MWGKLAVCDDETLGYANLNAGRLLHAKERGGNIFGGCASHTDAF